MDSGFMPNINNTVSPPPAVAMQVTVTTPICKSTIHLSWYDTSNNIKGSTADSQVTVERVWSSLSTQPPTRHKQNSRKWPLPRTVLAALLLLSEEQLKHRLPRSLLPLLPPPQAPAPWSLDPELSLEMHAHAHVSAVSLPSLTPLSKALVLSVVSQVGLSTKKKKNSSPTKNLTLDQVRCHYPPSKHRYPSQFLGEIIRLRITWMKYEEKMSPSVAVERLDAT